MPHSKVAVVFVIAALVSAAIAEIPAAKDQAPATAPGAEAPPRCPVTPTVSARPMGSLGSGLWYVNEDQTIWAAAIDLKAGSDGNKVPWIRPRGAELEVSGERIDAEAPPIQADIPCCYGGRFQPAGFTFPLAGCWRISARAGESTLVFTTLVREAPETPGPAAQLDESALVVPDSTATAELKPVNALYSPDPAHPVRPCLVIAHDCMGLDTFKICLLAPDRCDVTAVTQPAVDMRYQRMGR